MDKEQKPKQNSFAWLPQFMPGVAKLIREKRAQMGDAHVNECWRRGVMAGEPGWFFAAENRLSVGIPPVGMAEAFFEQIHPKYPNACMVYMRPVEPAHAPA